MEVTIVRSMTSSSSSSSSSSSQQRQQRRRKDRNNRSSSSSAAAVAPNGSSNNNNNKNSTLGVSIGVTTSVVVVVVVCIFVYVYIHSSLVASSSTVTKDISDYLQLSSPSLTTTKFWNDAPTLTDPSARMLTTTTTETSSSTTTTATTTAATTTATTTDAGTRTDDATGTDNKATDTDNKGVKLCPHVLSLYGLDDNDAAQGQRQRQRQQRQQQQRQPHAEELQIVKQQLLDTVQDAIKFHKYGGSLKSVQEFLDGQIDETLTRLGIDYEPTTSDGGAAAAAATTTTKTTTTSTTTAATQYLEEYYKTHDVPRGGYGQPLPIKYVDKRLAQAQAQAPPAAQQTQQQQGRRRLRRNLQRENNSNNNDIVKGALAGERWMDVMERVSNDRYRVSVGPDLNPPCPHIVSFSKGTGEEKKFCVVQDNNNNNTSSDEQQLQLYEEEEEECHIFSIGSNDQWGFEEDVMKLFQTRRCHTHTFDCTLDGPPKKKPNDDHVHFYPYCVGSSYNVEGSSKGSGGNKNDNDDVIKETAEKTKQKKKKKKFLPYSELWNVTGISSAPKLLKMDVEGFEFDVLTSMLSHAPPSTWPEQIMMEVHFVTRMVDVEWMLRTRQSAEIAMFFDILWNVGGYMPVTRKYFPKCGTCLEILLMRINCST